MKKKLISILLVLMVVIVSVPKYSFATEGGKVIFINMNRTTIQSMQEIPSLKSELEKRGYFQYEISNFSKPGFHSRHNKNYWCYICCRLCLYGMWGWGFGDQNQCDDWCIYRGWYVEYDFANTFKEMVKIEYAKLLGRF